jgi:PPOX class probable F420-dependent enzyme
MSGSTGDAFEGLDGADQQHPGGEQSLAETQRLASGSYISLTTYKKDGTAVATPVWVATDGSRLYVWTDGTAGKVKRIRNRGHVRIAPCDARGALQGEPVDASARVLDAPEDVAKVERLLADKYGVQFKLFRTAGKLARRHSGRVGLEITVV